MVVKWKKNIFFCNHLQIWDQMYACSHWKNNVVMYALIFFDLSETIVGRYQPHSESSDQNKLGKWSLKTLDDIISWVLKHFNEYMFGV